MTSLGLCFIKMGPLSLVFDILSEKPRTDEQHCVERRLSGGPHSVINADLVAFLRPENILKCTVECKMQVCLLSFHIIH